MAAGTWKGLNGPSDGEYTFAANAASAPPNDGRDESEYQQTESGWEEDQSGLPSGWERFVVVGLVLALDERRAVQSRQTLDTGASVVYPQCRLVVIYTTNNVSFFFYPFLFVFVLFYYYDSGGNNRLYMAL